METKEESKKAEDIEIDIISRLIYLVKGFSFIYDAKDPRHKDRNVLERTWFSIASQLHMSVEEAKTKWQRLRNNFSKAIERRVKAPRSKSAATKLQKPWAYEADMEFIRSHLHYHSQRAPSSSMKRHVPADVVSQSFPPQPDMLDVSEQISETSFMSLSDASSIGSIRERDLSHAGSHNPKARKYNVKDLDSVVHSITNNNNAFARGDQNEDPAVGWFKSLLPMYNTLSPIEKLEFQSKVTLELRNFILAKK